LLPNWNEIFGYIDVGDKCSKRNVLVTVLTCWCRLMVKIVFTLASGTNIQKMSPRSRLCHQHPKTVANITVIFLVIVKWFSDNVKCQHELVNSRKIGFDFDLIESWKRIVCFQYKLYGLVLNIYFYLTKFILYATLYFKLYILYFKVNSAVLRRKKYESYCMTHNKWYCLKGFCISGNKDVSNIWVTVITGTWPWFKSSVRIEHSASNYICFDIWS